MRSCGIHLTAISQEMHKISILDMTLKMTNWRLQQHLPEANKLMISTMLLHCISELQHTLHSMGAKNAHLDPSIADKGLPVLEPGVRRFRRATKLIGERHHLRHPMFQILLSWYYKGRFCKKENDWNLILGTYTFHLWWWSHHIVEIGTSQGSFGVCAQPMKDGVTQ